MAFYLPIHKIIDGYDLCCTPSACELETQRVEPVVVVWKERRGMNAGVICKQTLPSSLKNVLDETQPAIVINVDAIPDEVQLSSLRDGAEKWYQSKSNGKVTEEHAREIRQFKLNLLTIGERDSSLAREKKTAWDAEMNQRYDYVENNRAKWAIYVLDKMSDAECLYERWMKMLMEYLYELEKDRKAQDEDKVKRLRIWE